MSQIVYIGSFPPPYGGVTVKNALLLEALSERIDIEKLDLMDVKSFRPRAIRLFLGAIFGRTGCLVLGVSSDWRRRITDVMYVFNRAKMRRSLLFVMGGLVPEDGSYIQRMGCYKRMYVETESMRLDFEAAGARNVSVYPNCRKRPLTPCRVRKTAGGDNAA